MASVGLRAFGFSPDRWFHGNVGHCATVICRKLRHNRCASSTPILICHQLSLREILGGVPLSSREGPTRSALPLVFDSRHDTLRLAPVDGGRRVAKRRRALCALQGRSARTFDVPPELCLGPVRELFGRCEPGLVGLGALLHDQREVRFKHARPEGTLIHCMLFCCGPQEAAPRCTLSSRALLSAQRSQNKAPR